MGDVRLRSGREGDARSDGTGTGRGQAAEIVAKMVEGRLEQVVGCGKITLRVSICDEPDVTIEKLLKRRQSRVHAYERLEVGAGIEKKQADFVAAVMAQVKGAPTEGCVLLHENPARAGVLSKH